MPEYQQLVRYEVVEGVASVTLDSPHNKNALSQQLTGELIEHLETAGTDDAVRQAVARASKTLHNLRWFEVTQVRGHIESGAVAHWQVTINVGFTLE